MGNDPPVAGNKLGLFIATLERFAQLIKSNGIWKQLFNDVKGIAVIPGVVSQQPHEVTLVYC